VTAVETGVLLPPPHAWALATALLAAVAAAFVGQVSIAKAGQEYGSAAQARQAARMDAAGAVAENEEARH
jgi:hypothetical protein